MKKCLQCGVEFTPNNPKGKFHTDACRVKWNRNNKNRNTIENRNKENDTIPDNRNTIVTKPVTIPEKRNIKTDTILPKPVTIRPGDESWKDWLAILKQRKEKPQPIDVMDEYIGSEEYIKDIQNFHKNNTGKNAVMQFGIRRLGR